MGLLSFLRPTSRSIFRLATVLAASTALFAPAQTPATSIPLLRPSAIVFDPSGNLYVADLSAHVIRRIDISGNITTIAGTGIQGFSGDNGPATAADLDSPQGLAVDTSNRLYLSDTHNHRIRRVDLATNIITTIAGTGVAGYSGDNSPAATASLSLPTALALDTSGNLFVADTGNHRIRRIDTSGTITTIAGDGTQGFSGDNGPATQASIDSPTGLAVTRSVLYLVDTHNHRVRRIDLSTNTIATIAGTGALGFSGDNALASSAALALPHGVSADASGNLYLADTANHRIRRIDAATGAITTVAGDGTQNFSGDQGPAIAASLNLPRSVALSPAQLLTLTDTGNQRIRQVDAAAQIHTIAGLANIVPETLALSAPASIPYGNATVVTASLTAAATGRVTINDTFQNSTTSLGTADLTSTTSTLSLTTLPVGTHFLTASYPGDSSHASAQSNAFSVTVTPRAITATVTPLTILYGQPIPSLSGTLNNVLPQDSSNLNATFTTPATALSPAGTYPIAANLTGSAAPNYTLASTPSLTIAQAPSLASLTAASDSSAAGQPIILTVHIASTTSGVPTGAVTLLDNGSTILTTNLTSTGDATFTTSSLAAGAHLLSAAYAGDSNFLRSASTAQLLTVAAPTSTTDFTLTTSGASTQTVLAGSSSTFTLTMQSTGAALSSPITLSASGQPPFATVSFDPAYIPPGSTTAKISLILTIPAGTRTSSIGRVTGITLAILILIPFTRRRRVSAILAVIVTAFTLAATGCGDRINSTAQSSSAPPYAITVTGTTTGANGAVIQHTATVTLIVAQN
jgi:sugar lactone lactonase YvrE